MCICTRATCLWMFCIFFAPQAFKRLKDRNVGEWEPARSYLINPKAITMDELYGTYNLATRYSNHGLR